MAAAGQLATRASHRLLPGPVLRLRIIIVCTILVTWEGVARSGWLYRDVVPSLFVIAKAIAVTLADPVFYVHLYTTVYEIVMGLTIGGLSGFACGILLGSSRLISRSYEAFFYYLGPTPKIIFFPVM